MTDSAPDATPARGRAGVLGFVLAGLLLVGSAAWFALSLWHGFTTIDDRVERLECPCEETIEIREPGTQRVYHEYRSTLDGKTYDNSDGVRGMTVEVTDPDGDEVELEATKARETYSLGSREGVAVFRFEARTAGSYEVDAQADDEEFVLVVGKLGIFPTILTAIGGAVLLFVAGIVVLVLAFWRRSRAA